MNFFRKFSLVILTVVFVSMFLSGCGKEKISVETDEPVLKIGWSIWVGWMPWEIVDKQKLFPENGANAEAVYFDDYTESMEAFREGKLSAVSVTLNDAMALQDAMGDLQVVLINDVSNGGDGLLVKKDLNIDSVKDLKGRIVSLEENSVSHFLFLRALEENQMSPEDVEINNVPADLAGEAFLGSAFLDDKFTQAVVTWNPHLSIAKREGKGKVLFDSSQIYGEITDLLVMRKSTIEDRKKDVQAVVDAWYGAMNMIGSRKEGDESVKIMAKAAGVSAEDFENLMLDTEIFTKPRKTVEFMGADNKGKVKQIADKINIFLVSQGIVEKPVDLNDFINSEFVVEYYNEN